MTVRLALPALLLLAAALPLAALTLGPQRIVLLGEVHDNAAQHALRLAAWQALLAGGARPALLMEQLDRDRQGAIDALPPNADAAAVIAAGSAPGAGWNWDHYRPFIALALQHRLPIVAVNVSRDDTRKVIAQGLAASGFDAAVPADIIAAHAAAIVTSHCGLVDAAQAGRMALAQVARDQAMARAVRANAARGAVLLAGNGHVRRDIGVPRWLDPALRAQTVAIGLLEAGDDSAAEAAAYDRSETTPRQQRGDPCDGMRRPASAPAR